MIRNHTNSKRLELLTKVRDNGVNVVRVLLDQLAALALDDLALVVEEDDGGHTYLAPKSSRSFRYGSASHGISP